MTVGDSGGPVINQHGRLIGLNARIGLGPAANLHLTMRTIEAVFRQQPSVRNLLKQPARFDNPSEPIDLSLTDAASQTLNALTVKLQAGGESLCQGTVIDATTVISKLSEVQFRTGLQCTTTDEPGVALTLAAAHPSCDIAVLKRVEGVFSQQPELQAAAVSELQVSEILFSGTSGSAGIVTRTGHKEPGEPPKLGCTLTADASTSLRIDGVFPESAAQDAMLAVGDVLVSINDRGIKTFADLEMFMKSVHPGDRVNFGVNRAGILTLSSGRLRHSASNLLDRAEFLDGRSGVLSYRRTGFLEVIQHDASLNSREMGGPVVDSLGRLVAVNIARRSRESILAVPLETIHSLLAPDAE